MINLINKIKYFIQRGKRGFSDEDVWDFNYYLSNVISKGLRQLAENKISYPINLTDEQWTDILYKIVHGLEAPIIADDNVDLEFDEWKKGLNEALNKEKKALKLFVKYYSNLWD